MALTANYTDVSNSSIISWLDNVQCLGFETRLTDCPSDTLGVVYSCGRSELAGVQCIVSTCPQGAIRLQGGRTSTEGRVEICKDNIWGTVCDRLWDPTDARVACVQLGLPSSSK